MSHPVEKFKLPEWVGESFCPTQSGSLDFVNGWDKIVSPSQEIKFKLHINLKMTTDVCAYVPMVIIADR